MMNDIISHHHNYEIETVQTHIVEAQNVKTHRNKKKTPLQEPMLNDLRKTADIDLTKKERNALNESGCLNIVIPSSVRKKCNALYVLGQI